MTPQMQTALIRVSSYYDPDPAAVFLQILYAITSVYGDTMAMINVLADDRIHLHRVLNRHPALAEVRSLALTQTY